MFNLSSDALAILGIVITVFIAIIFYFLGLRTARPKLLGQGSGNQSIQVPEKDIMASSVQITNKPTFLGMKVNRGTAEINSARLYDPSIKEYVGQPLLWINEDSQELERTCMIKPGENKRLFIFAKERYSKEYFILSGKKLNSNLDPTTLTFSDFKKEFSIHLFDNIGHKYKFNIVVRNSEQSASIVYQMTIYTRLKLIREGFGMILCAFSFRRN